MHTLDASGITADLWGRRSCRDDGCVARRAAGCGGCTTANVLPPDPPGAGALRARLLALWSMESGLCQLCVSWCLGPTCWRVSVRVLLGAGGWGEVHKGLKHDEGTESSLFSPLG